MIALALLLVAATGVSVVLTRELVSQAVVLAAHGLSLGLLALALQAPDVALAIVVVGAAVTPMAVLLAVAAGHKTTAGDRP